MATLQEKIKQLIHYDPDDGTFTWLPRTETARYYRTWNTRFAHKPAGCVWQGYHRLRINNKGYLAHRLAWFYVYGEWPIDLIDHIDGNKTNNRINNLRLATKSQNMMNRKHETNTPTGIKGVHFNKRLQKYSAYIRANKKGHFLGYFSNAQDASEAYRLGSIKYHKEFRRI